MTGTRTELEATILAQWKMIQTTRIEQLKKERGIVKVPFLAGCVAKFLGPDSEIPGPEPFNRAVWNGKRFIAIEYDVYSDSSEREIETRIITL